MRRQLYLLVCCFSLFTSVFADMRHTHPQTVSLGEQSATKAIMYPGYCEIELINSSYDPIVVSGIFDDGYRLDVFTMYGFENRYIDLFYNGYCHASMYLSVYSLNWYTLYSDYTFVGDTLHIFPYFNKQVKVEVTKK